MQSLANPRKTSDRGVASSIKKKSDERFLNGRKAERSYARQLKGVARQINAIVKAFAPEGNVNDLNSMQSTLTRYAEILRPWARAVGWGMVSEVSRRDEAAWFAHGNEMGRLLREEIRTAPTGDMLREILERQVTLITSLPIEAGQRVHKLATESLINSSRASEIAKEILRTGDVTESRAVLIARTETARCAAGLTQSRAQFVGSTHYIWHTATDSDVRPGHKAMNGKIFRWDTPPEVEENGRSMRHGPGEIWNCRCFAEPIIPEEI